MEDENRDIKIADGSDSTPSESDMNLLEEAAGGCELEACEKFLEEGADVNARDEDGSTPLLWAVLSGSQEVVELLIARGADINGKNNEGESPLHWAAISGNIKIAEVLLAKGAQVNVKDIFGVTPMRSAILNEDKDLIELFRRHGGSE